MKLLKAYKKSLVKGVFAKGGEKITTYSSDGVESVNVAGTKDVIVTRVDDNGQPVLTDGHPNTWIIKSIGFFLHKYEGIGNHLYRPRGEEQTFVVLDRDVCFMAPWGEPQRVKKGGVLNISNFDDVYGIAEEEFKSTYIVLETKEF